MNVQQPAPSDDDVRVVIGDIHSDLESLLALLRHVGAVDASGARTPGFFLVCVGDLLHLGHDSRADDRAVAEYCRGLFDVLLCGNHELLLAYGLEAGRFAACHHSTFPETQHILRGWARRGQLQPACAVDDWLVTHAGVHPEWMRTLPAGKTAAQLARIINRRWASRLSSKVTDPLFDSVGPLRGGARAPGGLFWCDHREHLTCAPGADPVPQIYGHTPQADGPQHDPDRRLWCVDVGAALSGRACGLVKHGAGGDWEPVDIRTRPSRIPGF